MSRTICVTDDTLLEKDFDSRTALAEASRCLLCHDAPCSEACPAGTDPARFIRSLRFKNIWGAAETIRENNPLGGSCALICPANELCESACVRAGLDQPVRIAKLQRFVTEQERKMGMHILKTGPSNGKKVACIGAGPASLACASVLAREGCRVTILEQSSRPGGMLALGIPRFRLPQETIDFDLAQIEKLGVEFRYNTTVSTSDLDLLVKQFDAVFIGVGLWKPKTLDLQGKNLDGVIHALDYLQNARRYEPSEKGNRVVVIGDGDVAMDCATTAQALGAESVKLVFCRPIADASANIAETLLAVSMGIPVVTEFFPQKINGKNGRVTNIHFTGADRQSVMNLQTDKVILAVGQERSEELAGVTKQKGIFSGGDWANGGKTVVAAIAEGKKAAASIIDYLDLPA